MTGSFETKEAVRRYFDREADDYLDAYEKGRPGDARHDTLTERRDLVLRMMPRESRRVLDIGSGPGVFTSQLLARGAQCCMVDISYEMIAAARRRSLDTVASTIRFMVADVDQLPFADEAFDTVLCVGVLQYLESPDAAVGELARVVAPGGHVILTFPNARSPLNRIHRAAIAAARTVRRLLKYLGAEPQADPSRLTFREDIPNRWCSINDIERRAHAAGLTIDGIIYHVLQFPFSVTGLGGVISFWNRLVARIEPDPGRSWAREGIVRLTRPL